MSFFLPVLFCRIKKIYILTLIGIFKCSLILTTFFFFQNRIDGLLINVTSNSSEPIEINNGSVLMARQVRFTFEDEDNSVVLISLQYESGKCVSSVLTLCNNVYFQRSNIALFNERFLSNILPMSFGLDKHCTEFCLRSPLIRIKGVTKLDYYL